MVDRSNRYKNNGKGAPKGEKEAEARAEKTATGKNAPQADKPGAVGKEGSDAGPIPGEVSEEFGVTAKRHAREHGEMGKRHTEEVDGMMERHGKERGDMHKRQQKEMGAHVQNPEEAGAEGKAEKTAGSPKELGKTKDKGEKGSNA